MRPQRSLAAAVALAATAALAADQPLESAARVYPEVSGATLFVERCAVCHGSDGRGDGPLADGLTRQPTNLRRLSIVNGGEFPAERVRMSIDGRDLPALHGTREMPVWGYEFKLTPGAYGERRVQEHLDLLVDYLHGLQDSAVTP
ncbi:MAG: c-type cytochrome [Gammaproteobacteria bacterium]